jgi:hypothetical protein
LQYEKLTGRSRLELNADKTEIHALNIGRSFSYGVEYGAHNIEIKTAKEL